MKSMLSSTESASARKFVSTRCFANLFTRQQAHHGKLGVGGRK